MSPYIKEMNSIKSSKEFLAGDPQTVQKYREIIHYPLFYDSSIVSHIEFSTDLKRVKETEQLQMLFLKKDLPRSFDWQSAMKDFSFPILILCGDIDFIASETASAIHTWVLTSTLIQLNQCGHFPFIEKTEETLEAIKIFMESNECSVIDSF